MTGDGLCGCGCGQATTIPRWSSKRDGRVAGVPMRFKPGHKAPTAEPQWTVDENGCWLWQGFMRDSGYGLTYYAGRSMEAHRANYLRYVGPIAPGMHLDHLCKVTRCCNPEHLEQVTPAENIYRSKVCKLNPEQVAAIRALKGKLLQREIAAQFGISRENVSQIHRGKTWPDVPPPALGAEVDELVLTLEVVV